MLKINNLTKSYGETLVLEDINLEIASNSFIAFLGPSGCGKTTLLRLIAGLIDNNIGEIFIDDKRIDKLPPAQRNTAMVFQNYALYPHMSVENNLKFGLENIKLPKDEIASRINHAMEILEISHLANKKPGQLSGGQKQRVAIGRAIVKNPKIFLFDEPLSNLDASLRLKTRIELAELHRKLDAIMILVTHDQIEAMTLADKIVVLNDKCIQQFGAPIDIYNRPVNKFVASFVGAPEINYLPIKIINNKGKIEINLGSKTSIKSKYEFDSATDYSAYEIGIRPEYLKCVSSENADLIASIEIIERLGDRSIIYAILETGTKIRVQDEGNTKYKIGDKFGILINSDGIILFDNNGTAIYHESNGGMNE